MILCMQWILDHCFCAQWTAPPQVRWLLHIFWLVWIIYFPVQQSKQQNVHCKECKIAGNVCFFSGLLDYPPHHHHPCKWSTHTKHDSLFRPWYTEILILSAMFMYFIWLCRCVFMIDTKCVEVHCSTIYNIKKTHASIHTLSHTSEPVSWQQQ